VIKPFRKLAIISHRNPKKNILLPKIRAKIRGRKNGKKATIKRRRESTRLLR